jgi:hypothetical protein
MCPLTIILSTLFLKTNSMVFFFRFARRNPKYAGKILDWSLQISSGVRRY